MGSGACGRRRRTPKSQEEAIPPRGKTSARSSRKPTWPQSESICGKFVNFVATGSRRSIAYAYVWDNTKSALAFRALLRPPLPPLQALLPERREAGQPLEVDFRQRPRVKA